MSVSNAGDQPDISNYTNLTQTSVVIGNYPDFLRKNALICKTFLMRKCARTPSFKFSVITILDLDPVVC